MNEIKHEEYEVNYIPETATVTCTGNFRLRGPEYDPILEILNAAADAGHASITLNLCELQFLNSSGINTLSKFVIGMRKQKDSKLVIQGSEQYPWQKKSLRNFEKLLPTLQLEIQ